MTNTHTTTMPIDWFTTSALPAPTDLVARTYRDDEQIAETPVVVFLVQHRYPVTEDRFRADGFDWVDTRVVPGVLDAGLGEVVPADRALRNDEDLVIELRTAEG